MRPKRESGASILDGASRISELVSLFAVSPVQGEIPEFGWSMPRNGPFGTAKTDAQMCAMTWQALEFRLASGVNYEQDKGGRT